MMIGDHPEFNKLADRYFTLDDLFAVRDRLVGLGQDRRQGGGHAAGQAHPPSAEGGEDPTLRSHWKPTTPSTSARTSSSPSW